jgi:voltage-gated potassium channel
MRSNSQASPSRRSGTPWRLLAFGTVLALLIAAGTVVYHALEGWSWFESLYVTVITLTSIGYGDHEALSVAGRIFTMLLALGGISTVALVVTEALGTIITGELRDLWGDRSMRKRIGALERHVIVCGYGRVGRQVCADLSGGEVPFVVIERQELVLADTRDAGAHPLLGDATGDATLRLAGIERARALIAVAGTDADNVLITMTARLLNPTLSIVARAQDQVTVPKLLRAGATRTVSPQALVGGRMAQAVLHPAVLDFIEVATRKEYPELQMEEQLVRPGSALDGKTVEASGLRSRLGLILVAIKRRDGHLAFNPADDAAVVAGDTLITLGPPEQLARADAMAVAR